MGLTNTFSCIFVREIDLDAVFDWFEIVFFFEANYVHGFAVDG